MFVRHKKSIVVIMLFLIISIVILAVLYYQFTKPTNASVITSPYPATNQSNLNLIPKNFTNQYVTFNYPDILNLKPTPSFGLPLVSVVTMSYPDVQTWVLSIEISNIASGNLQDNSAYKLRTSDPTTYELSETSVNGTQVPVMIDTTKQTFNKVAFLVNGQYQAVVSLLGDDPGGNSPLDNTLQMILSSWQWHI